MTGLPSLLAALGLVGVVFALLSFVVVLVSGAGFSSDLGWIGGNLALGVLLLVSAAVLNIDALRERMASGEAKRAGRYGTSAIVSTALGIAILGMLGFLAERNSHRFDWSEQKVHTLSDQSKKVLAGLDQDVNVLVLVSKLDAEPIRELLDRYAYESERFVVEYADPNVRPGLLEEYQITPEQLQDGRGFVRIAIGDDSVEVTELSEENVTNAMVKLTRTGDKVVYFLEGHAERPVEGEDAAGRSGYGRAAEALRNENYRVEKLLLASTGEVPQDADAVVLAGPTRPLLDVENAALERYLARGGALMVLVDPRVRTSLVEKLGEWGVTLGDDVVVDRTLALFGRAMSPFAASYDTAHEITRDLREPALFHEVRSVAAGPDFTELVFTGEASWAERDLARLDAEGKVAMEDGDVAGPVAVAAAGRPKVPATTDGARADAGADADAVAAAAAGETADAGEEDSGEKDGGDDAHREPRLAVYGDADFASNEYIDAYRNRDLFVNTANWLIGDVEAIAVRPNKSRASRFQLTAEDFRTIRSLSLFVLPEAIAVLGVLTWWSRRHPGGG
jgi:ABC-type uncharacterized transport system involved in gliding motility auxiliary subunit